MCHGHLVFSGMLRVDQWKVNSQLHSKWSICQKMIPEPGDANREITVTETFHLQTDDELTYKELKQIEADDQAIQTILLGLSEDIYSAVDSYETTQEIWLRVQQMMKGSDIGIQEKKAKLFNEWERFTSNKGDLIESYYHRFLELMNDLKRNKHFPEKIASNLKFLNNLQPKCSRHVTIVHQTKDLHTADYTQLYDFLKYNQKDVDELKAERLAKNQDPLALMANSNNPYAFLAPHQDQSSFNQNYLQQPIPNSKDITDPTTAMNIALALMAKAFNNNQRISSNPKNRHIAQPGMKMGQNRQIQMVGGNGRNQFRQYTRQNAMNLAGYNDVIRNQNQIGNGNLVAARVEGNATGQNGNQIRCYNCRGVEGRGENLTPSRRTDSAPVYDTDRSAEVHENCDNNEIFNLFTQEEQYTELLEPIPESHQVPQHNNDVISEDTNVKQGGETLEQHPAIFEETHALYDSLYQNLATELEKVNSVNHKLKKTNTDLTTELARYKNQERCFEISQEKYDKLERCYQQSVYQEQYLSKKINALHLSTAKFVGDFKSLANEADASLAKHKAFELEIKRLLKAVVSQDIMIIVQNESVVDTSDLQTELERTKERFKNCIIKKESEYAKLWNDWQRFLSKKYQPKVSKPKKVESHKSLATPKPRKSKLLLRWSPTGKLFDKKGKIVDSSKSKSQFEIYNDDNACTSNSLEPKIKRFPNSTSLLDRNDHVAAILGFGDLQWGNILITRVYFVEGLGHNLFLVGQLCDSDLEVAFRRDACFVRNLEGVDLLKGDRSTNLYTINLHDMASASPICLMARASSTKPWLWHQRLSHLNFDTINDLARNDLVAGLPKFK
nr:retrovirus-related Pol polyprotein from transposon TNT 1-94 [Tanacetum cinerariifolium]